MPIQLINLHYQKDPEAVYIGRGRDSQTNNPLHNPYKIGEHGTRQQVISMYRTWLQTQLASKTSPQTIEMNRLWRMQKTGTLTLACWCTPAPCHGDIILEFLLDPEKAKQKNNGN